MRFFSIPLFLVLSTVFLSGCEEQVVEKAERIRPVRSIVVGDIAVLQERSFAGRAKAAVELDLAFNVSGPLIGRPVDVGQEIKAGTLVAQIDPDRFKAELDRASANLSRTKATARNAKLSLDRDRTLFEKGHISKAKLDRTLAKADEANADIQSAKANVSRAKIEFDYTRLKAPIDGIVVQTYVENFENVQAKQSIMRIVDNSQIEMVVDIPEDLISYAPQVKKLFVVFDTFKDIEIPATISKIGTEASENTRTYPVTLVMDQPKNVKILPGMAGRAFSNDTAVAGQTTDVEVPISSLLTSVTEGGSFVWKVDEKAMVVKKIAVKVGALTDHGAVVTEGVKKGDRIVTAGVNYLKENQNITLLKSEATK